MSVLGSIHEKKVNLKPKLYVTTSSVLERKMVAKHYKPKITILTEIRATEECVLVERVGEIIYFLRVSAYVALPQKVVTGHHERMIKITSRQAKIKHEKNI